MLNGRNRRTSATTRAISECEGLPQSRHRAGHSVRRFSWEAVVRWRALGGQRCAKSELVELTIPVKRVVSPTRSSEDIAGPAVFLASDLSVYVTGHIIMADGGYRTV